MFGINSVSSCLFEKLIKKPNHQLVLKLMFSTNEYRKFDLKSFLVTNGFNLENKGLMRTITDYDVKII